jgi:hypothetical protein
MFAHQIASLASIDCESQDPNSLILRKRWRVRPRTSISTLLSTNRSATCGARGQIPGSNLLECLQARSSAFWRPSPSQGIERMAAAHPSRRLAVLAYVLTCGPEEMRDRRGRIADRDLFCSRCSPSRRSGWCASSARRAGTPPLRRLDDPELNSKKIIAGSA